MADEQETNENMDTDVFMRENGINQSEEEGGSRLSEHRRSKYLLREDDDGSCEAKVRMELELKKRKEKEKEEFAEYEAIRKAEREKEAHEIQLLRERREQRKKERSEEEKRLTELRALEDQRKRGEEEERHKRKREEERLKKEKMERHLLEREQRNQFIGRPNFIINKRGDGGVSEDENEEPVKVVQKTREQLEAEKRAVLEQRCQPLNTQGFNLERLKEKAKELHQLIYRLEGDKYDLMHRFERQNYELMEMSEKARQMNKGGKNPKVNVPQIPDPLLTKMSGIPHKVQMYSQYERVKDHRSFTERRDLYTGPLYGEDFERVQPTMKIIMTEQGARAIQDDQSHVEEAMA